MLCGPDDDSVFVNAYISTVIYVIACIEEEPVWLCNQCSYWVRCSLFLKRPLFFCEVGFSYCLRYYVQDGDNHKEVVHTVLLFFLCTACIMNRWLGRGWHPCLFWICSRFLLMLSSGFITTSSYIPLVWEFLDFVHMFVCSIF